MQKYILPIVVLGAAAFLLIRRTAFAKNLNFVIRGVKLGGRWLAPRIEITIGLQNPSNQKANFKSLSGLVKWNDAEFANISSFNAVTIAANSETQIKVNAEPSVMGIFETVKKIIKEGIKGKITIVGTANVDNLQIPINVTKNL
jgi:LEA14-like dessication related protein